MNNLATQLATSLSRTNPGRTLIVFRPQDGNESIVTTSLDMLEDQTGELTFYENGGPVRQGAQLIAGLL